MVRRGSKEKETGGEGLGERVGQEALGKSTEGVSREAKRTERVQQCNMASCAREKQMGVRAQSLCEGGKDGEMEMFQGGRERQMNRQIITNAIISCYSSNPIVTQKKRMRQGVGDGGGGATRRAEPAGRGAEVGLACQGAAAAQRQQMLGLQFLWQHTQATSVQTWWR